MELARREEALRLGAVSNTLSAHPKTLKSLKLEALDPYKDVI